MVKNNEAVQIMTTMSKITQADIKNIIKIPGQARGQVFFTDFEYIKQIKGEAAVRLLEEKIKAWGVPLDYENMQTTEWYPLGLRVISLLAIKEAFNLQDKDIEEIGRVAPKLSFIVKILMKTFISIEKSFKETSNYWQKHYSVGELVPFKIDISKKHTLLRLKNFKVHPILCPYFKGYFFMMAKFILKTEKVTIEEIKCPFSGGEFHEFSAKWE